MKVQPDEHFHGQLWGTEVGVPDGGAVPMVEQ